MFVMTARRLCALLGHWRTAGAAYGALADRIALLLLDGRVPPEARLPSERELAAQLGLSRTTVAAAYAQLRTQGYLHSVRGSGSMTNLPQDSTSPQASMGATQLDFSKAALPAAAGLAEVAILAAGELPAHLGLAGYDPIGLPRLREAIAERYRARGLPTTAADIMVTLGAQHAIALLARVLLRRGDTALVEAPSYPHAYDALRTAGGRLVPVTVDARLGWDEDAMMQAFRRARPALAYVMPDFHNPTGQVMGPELRGAILREAQRAGSTVLADETMAELNIDGEPAHEPLAKFGPAVLIGSLGKTVWGGLRVGWVRADPELIQQLVRQRSAGDLGTPILEQLMAVHMLEQYPVVLAARAAQLRQRRDRLFKLVRTHLPDWDVPPVAGGLSTWIHLGKPLSSQLSLAARSRGLILPPGPAFGPHATFERFLRLPFSYSAETTSRAVDILAESWRELRESPVSQAASYTDVI